MILPPQRPGAMPARDRGPWVPVIAGVQGPTDPHRNLTLGDQT